MWLLKILKILKSIFLEVDKIKPIHDFKDDNLLGGLYGLFQRIH